MNGILALWKPAGITSHDCVYKLRKILGTKKVGHTGTLDPAVTGVLPIMIGKATKLSEYMTATGKMYEATICLGSTTTTEDATGEVVETKALTTNISPDAVQAALNALTGEIKQIPPMFSAVKVNGRKLYEYARLGIEVERPERQVTIHALERLDSGVVNAENPSFKIRIDCSKGTYVRTLAVMLGELLGYPAHMEDLVRTMSGTFTREDCITLEELNEWKATDTPADFLYDMMLAVQNLTKINLSDAAHSTVKHGGSLTEEEVQVKPGDTVELRALLYNDVLVAVYKPHPRKEGMWKPEKMILKTNGSN
ncbi:tRNA pseudouridine(55) synthase TruB [Brochothrix thermosphacta]|uniref:tRNA pseudouridine(55) synthase TruB n=1 Tax=Brochothrix thermosphacta TaxID=2756 RepID=UPI00083F6BD0|nr:tRNA pseudouridine(55) synthase TruB [Brochothrix thermosphacta]ODJ57164.1 tRNA pseudouridine(55) synthase TruB [Brochothrix thermosphacta]ODJ72501.1 tRNA pseudouridine(55) synthase TruB [Brochothrix thermosphacta]